jgi:diguanylate cyclase (GGDEF)-like protein
LAKKADLVLRAIQPDGEAANEHEHEAAWQLIRDDLFDRGASDAELEALVTKFAAKTATPYAEVVRRLLGEDMGEPAARTLFRRILGHRATLSKALDRPVHVRVAALDLLTMGTMGGSRPARYESRAILVSPALLEKALEEAGSDAITGLPQRAHFMSLLRHELRQRRRRNVVVVYIDLDRFKRVNDEHGHARGDDVIRALARCGQFTLRRGDVLARIGGDEFAVLLVDVSVEEAEAAVRRLRERFEAQTAPLGVSFSAGIATAARGEAADELLARADAAMYRDKRERAASDRPA